MFLLLLWSRPTRGILILLVLLVLLVLLQPIQPYSSHCCWYMCSSCCSGFNFGGGWTPLAFVLYIMSRAPHPCGVHAIPILESVMGKDLCTQTGHLFTKLWPRNEGMDWRHGCYPGRSIMEIRNDFELNHLIMALIRRGVCNTCRYCILLFWRLECSVLSATFSQHPSVPSAAMASGGMDKEYEIRWVQNRSVAIKSKTMEEMIAPVMRVNFSMAMAACFRATKSRTRPKQKRADDRKQVLSFAPTYWAAQSAPTLIAWMHVLVARGYHDGVLRPSCVCYSVIRGYQANDSRFQDMVEYGAMWCIFQYVIL